MAKSPVEVRQVEDPYKKFFWLAVTVAVGVGLSIGQFLLTKTQSDSAFSASAQIQLASLAEKVVEGNKKIEDLTGRIATLSIELAGLKGSTYTRELAANDIAAMTRAFSETIVDLKRDIQEIKVTESKQNDDISRLKEWRNSIDKRD